MVDIMETVYFIGEEPYTGEVKIGRTGGDVRDRLKQLQTGNPRTLVVLGEIKCGNSTCKENELHAKYKDRHVRGEWYTLSTHEIKKLCSGDELAHIPEFIEKAIYEGEGI